MLQAKMEIVSENNDADGNYIAMGRRTSRKITTPVAGEIAPRSAASALPPSRCPMARPVADWDGESHRCYIHRRPSRDLVERSSGREKNRREKKKLNFAEKPKHLPKPRAQTTSVLAFAGARSRCRPRFLSPNPLNQATQRELQNFFFFFSSSSSSS
ncbi:hypothetical protein TIFTF001_007620 [Ficus carica]|uniref:Uncharacterized protein n=1 Tax=Ficus carica TaxID=3494 RepID=A0AA88CX97_FICCA|nr:hypothetical protein TIFTF001_007620 [Ficus carica]